MDLFHVIVVAVLLIFVEKTYSFAGSFRLPTARGGLPSLTSTSRLYGEEGSGREDVSIQVSSVKDDNADVQETIHRGFSTETSLPVLGDCNNYYSGESEGRFWHQNSDQVIVYIPIAESVNRHMINVKFAARLVTVNVDGMDAFSFPCTERVIPDGCFWMLEIDNNTDDRYLVLDLEKRFRMINWKSLFGSEKDQELPEMSADDQVKRLEMLKKLIGDQAFGEDELRGENNVDALDAEVVEE
jgi:hypothetical protein